MTSKFPSHRFAAFSLLEVLVSMGVLSLLLVLLLSMVDSATRLWRTNENRVDAFREARAAINIIAEDLSSLKALPQENFFFSDADPKPDVSTGASVAHMRGRLFFITALPLDQQPLPFKDKTIPNKSDLCTVGYFLAFDRTSLTGGTSTPRSYNLYRYLRGSNDTFGPLKSGNLIAASTDPSADALEPTTSPTGNAELLAKNIVGFTIKAWTLDPLDPTQRTPFRKSDQTPFPDVIEISLSAISNAAADRLSTTNSTDWEISQDPRLEQDVRTFTARVFLAPARLVKTTP